MTPAAVVALKLLRALRVDTLDEARSIVAMWAARPRLAPGDIRAVLSEFDQADDLARGVQDHRGTEEWDVSEMPKRGTVRTNLDD